MQTYDELVEEYNVIVEKLFSGEALSQKEVDMIGRFFGGGGTFPEAPDSEREKMFKMTPDNVHELIKELLKLTIAQSGRARKNLEGWEIE